LNALESAVILSCAVVVSVELATANHLKTAMLRPIYKPHVDFSAMPQIFVRESFAREEAGLWRVYAGVQNDLFQTDELYFSERKGAFNNALVSPARTVAAGLTLEGCSLDSVAMDARGIHNFDPLLRVESGVVLVGYSSNHYTEGTDYRVRTALEWRLYDTSTGALAGQAGVDGVLGIVPDGSYLLWARAGGEWSAIKTRVGEGGFTWNSGVFPGPGSPLYSKLGLMPEAVVTEANQESYVYAFDPLARIVSASCVTTRDVRSENGQMDIPAGSLLIAGVRASRGGPQTALWLLRENRTARLLAAETTFSDGICECGKTNHFASDVVQGSDGRIYVLSECDLNVYDPNRSDVFNRLLPFPAETYGHPGGHALRFLAGDATHWTENLKPIVTGDGRNFYNQLVYRAGATNYGGVGSRWHGTNCAELFRGKLFSVRQDEAETDENGLQTIDSITAGRWDRASVLTQKSFSKTWQRLRRCGESLFVFGFESFSSSDTTEPVDAPTLHIAREDTLQSAAFPYFIRRATPAWFDDGAPRLLVAAREAIDGIGIANRVVEIESATTRICAFYDEEAEGFAFSVAQFEAAGGDINKLPPYLWLEPRSGADAGGVWVASITEPDDEFLTLSIEDGWIRYSGLLPYDSTFWGVLCMEIDADGGVEFGIYPGCSNAKCVFDLLPEGTKWRHLRFEVANSSDPLWSLQLSDLNEDKRLNEFREAVPNLWLRFDSAAPFDDLASYTHLAAFSRELWPSEPVTKSVDVMVLYTPELLPCAAPAIVRRG
jgi:hypothetical protein